MRRIYRLIILGLVGASGAGILSLAKGTSAEGHGLLQARPDLAAGTAALTADRVVSRAVNDCLPQALRHHVAAPTEMGVPAAAQGISASTVSPVVRKGDRIGIDGEAFDARLSDGTLAGADISQCVESQTVTVLDEDMQKEIGTWELRL